MIFKKSTFFVFYAKRQFADRAFDIRANMKLFCATVSTSASGCNDRQMHLTIPLNSTLWWCCIAHLVRRRSSWGYPFSTRKKNRWIYMYIPEERWGARMLSNIVRIRYVRKTARKRWRHYTMKESKVNIWERYIRDQKSISTMTIGALSNLLVKTRLT